MRIQKIKIDVDKSVADCRLIADNYIAKWKPIDPSWDIVDGCLYIRLSTDEQVSVEKGSLEQQIHILVAEIESRSRQDRFNYKIINVHIEPGISGQERERTEFLALKRAVRAGKYGFVAFKEIARIARDSQIWQEFFKLCQDKKCKVIIKGLPIDPNDPSQILQLSIIAAFAQYEAQQTAKRIRESTFSAMINNGKFNSTHKTLGLDPLIQNGQQKVGLYQPNSTELETVTKIMRVFTKYKSHQKTLEYCHENNLTNKNGTAFGRNSLTKLLTNTKYLGKWIKNLENKTKNQDSLPNEQRYYEIDLPHGAVVPLYLWHEVQASLEVAKGMGKNTKVKRVSPLSGLLQHSDGTTYRGFSGTGRTQTSYYYRNDKHKINIRADLIEADAAKIVTHLIGKTPHLQKIIQT